MRKNKRKQRKSLILLRKKRELREKMRLRKVLAGLDENLTIREIHYKTGMSEKNVRKIMFKNPSEVTFKLMQRG